MPYVGQTNFTAATAKVVMGDTVIGALQSLRIDDNYNTIRVGQIGTPVDIAHVPGRVQVNVSARRMIINYDLVNTFLRPVVSKDTTGALGNDISANAVRSQLTDNPYANVDGVNSNAIHKYLNFYFDIAIYDDSDNLLYIVRKCSVASRSITVDQGAIIISEDVTIFGRYIDYGNQNIGNVAID